MWHSYTCYVTHSLVQTTKRVNESGYIYSCIMSQISICNIFRGRRCARRPNSHICNVTPSLMPTTEWVNESPYLFESVVSHICICNVLGGGGLNQKGRRGRVKESWRMHESCHAYPYVTYMSHVSNLNAYMRRESSQSRDDYVLTSSFVSWRLDLSLKVLVWRLDLCLNLLIWRLDLCFDVLIYVLTSWFVSECLNLTSWFVS